jgi:hypothetical protein
VEWERKTKMKRQNKNRQKEVRKNSLLSLFREGVTEQEKRTVCTDIFGSVNSFDTAKRILSILYNIELKEKPYDDLFESLDSENKEYAVENPYSYGVWAAGVLCNSEPDRDGNY